MKTTKTIPTLRNENEEREFWENHDTTDYFDTSKVKMVRFPNLKKTTKSISIRLPVDMLDELRLKSQIQKHDIEQKKMLRFVIA